MQNPKIDLPCLSYACTMIASMLKLQIAANHSCITTARGLGSTLTVVALTSHGNGKREKP